MRTWSTIWSAMYVDCWIFVISSLSPPVSSFTRLSVVFALPVPSRSASQSSAKASISGGISNRGWVRFATPSAMRRSVTGNSSGHLSLSKQARNQFLADREADGRAGAGGDDSDTDRRFRGVDQYRPVRGGGDRSRPAFDRRRRLDTERCAE